MKIVTAKFTDERKTDVFDICQWDYGQVLRIEGLKLPKMVEIHFSLQETAGEAITRIGTTKDGVTDVIIPDSMLENEGAGGTYKIYAWVYLTDADSGSTEYKVTIHVKARSKPEIPGGGDNPDIFHEAVLAVRESAEKAEEAQRQAEGYAHGREDLPERAEDNAKYYSDKASEDAKKTAEDRKEVERLVESVAGIDEQVAKVEKLSKDAQEAATQAETHKQAAETAKESVENLSAQVQKNKESVDKTAQDFALKAQQALADVNNAGQTQTERVQSAGTTAVENIENAQNTATQAVETAKNEAIKAVQTEGTTQTGAVTAEGEKQVQAVQAAAQEIIADREQIQKNATDIADLQQKKADAIVESASGTLLNVKDSSGAFFEDFSMSGKTTQDGTPTPDTPVEIVNAGRLNSDTGKYEVDVKITGKNLFDMNKFIDTCNFTKNEDGTFRIDKFVKRYDCFMPANTILSIEVLKVEDSSGAAVLELFYEDGKNTYIGFNQVGVKTFLIQKDVAYIKVLAYRNHEYKYIQLEKGTVATPYEPYKEQILTLTSDRRLTKWDRLVKQDGQIGWLYNSAEILLNGTENWIRHSEINKETTQAFGLSIPDLIYGEDAAIGQNGLTDKFRYVNAAWAKDEAGQAINNGRLFINIEKTKASTVEEFKAWLKSNNVKVVYKTETPEFVPLPQEQQDAIRALSTYYPSTVVSNSENMEMELSYVADTKNYTDRKIEEAVTAQVQNLANLLSLMPLSTQAAMIEADTNNILDNMEVQK